MQAATVERSAAEGSEILVVRPESGEGDAFVYARPIGQDAWFHFVGTEPIGTATGPAYDHDPFAAAVDPDQRAAIDRFLLDRGYPIRAQDGSTPPEGQLELVTDEGTRGRPFYTHPGTFVVYRDRGPTPTAPPDEGTTHVAILERTQDTLRVRVDAAGGPPPEYAIREAALVPYALPPTEIPTVSIEN